MKTNKITQLTLLALGLVFILSACRPSAEETPAPEPAAVNFSPIARLQARSSPMSRMPGCSRRRERIHGKCVGMKWTQKLTQSDNKKPTTMAGFAIGFPKIFPWL